MVLITNKKCPWCRRLMPNAPQDGMIYTCNDCLMGDVVFCPMGDEPTKDSKPAFQVKERDPMLESEPKKGTPEYKEYLKARRMK